jgi:hypothetical protein
MEAPIGASHRIASLGWSSKKSVAPFWIPLDADSAVQPSMAIHVSLILSFLPHLLAHTTRSSLLSIPTRQER